MPTNTVTRRAAIATTAAAFAAPAMPVYADSSPLADLIEAEAKARAAFNAFSDHFDPLEEADMEWKRNAEPRLVETIGGAHLDALVFSRQEGLEEIDKQAKAARKLLAGFMDSEGKQAAQTALDATVNNAKARFMAEHDAMESERSAYLEADRRQGELSAAMWNAADAILAYPPRDMEEVRQKAAWIARADREGRLGCLSDGEALISSYLAMAEA